MPLLCEDFKVGELMYLLILLRYDMNGAVRKKDGKDQEMEAPYWASAFDSLRYLSPILPSA